MNHFDVVPVDRTAWKVEPFAAIIQNGEIWGRGTMDMKGIAIEQLLAFVTLKKSGIIPPRDIVILSTADEETNGTYGIRWMIENHFSDINAEYVLDEGGFGTRDILSPGKLVFGIAVGEKQTLWLRVRASYASLVARAWREAARHGRVVSAAAGSRSRSREPSGPR